MKFLISVLILANLVFADNADSSSINISTYGYHSKFGIPEAERIKRKEEELQNNSRIVGGVPAKVGQYPFKAGLIGDVTGLNALSVCGGALISPSRVATAAHCWNDGFHQTWRFTVVLGSEFLFSGGTRITTSAAVVHPNWNPILIRNDVAVLYLPSAVTANVHIAPISLPSGVELFENFAGQSAVALGYGTTRDGVDIDVNQSLQHVNLNVITNSVCTLAFPIYIQASNICTSGFGGVGMCSGDSGGPLVINRDGRPVLIGLWSFRSDTGCQSGLPSVFARVTSYVDFFNSHLLFKDRK